MTAMADTYGIGEFAKRIGRSPSTVRRWEQEGKITPKRLTCDTCHVEVDRDENASLNIRDWSVISPGLVESTALFVLGPFATGDSSDDGMTHHLKRACKTGSNTGRARRGKNNSRASEHEVRDENFLKGASK